MELMPQESAVKVWGLEFMEGEGGRRWQVRGIAFKLIVDKKNLDTHHWKGESTQICLIVPYIEAVGGCGGGAWGL